MEDASARAAAHYRRAGWSPSTALDWLGNALYFGPRAVEEAIRECEQRFVEYAGDRASEANIVMWLGPLNAMRGQFDEGREYVSRARKIFEEFGLTIAVVDTCGRLSAAIDMLARSPDAAEESLRHCCEFLLELGQTSVLATRGGELAAAIYAQARFEDAEEWTLIARNATGKDDVDAALSWQPVQAMILAHRGAIDEAEALALSTLELVARTDAVNRHADSLLALAEVLRLSGRDNEAEATVRTALQLYERKGNLVSAEKVRGLLPETALTE